MEKLWKIKAAGNKEEVKHISESLGIDYVLGNLLVQRGIKTYDEAKSFFRPQLEKLYDPFLMKDMDLAVNRIEKALRRKEKILIYGDYDVDGTTSVALVYSFFREFYPNLDYYIPDRYAEGYGISYKGIDYSNDHDVSLIIALDCGIKAIEKVKYANKRNIDVIICDHHTPDENFPEALAVLDPKRKDCTYPFKELSGCGVGFKLLQAYTMKNDIDLDRLYRYLDLVVVSIASDIVPIIDENRILAYYGLERLNQGAGLGLQNIIETSGLLGKVITIDDIVFKIGPRINAAGRMESGRAAVELLITNNKEHAIHQGIQINKYNQKRRDIDQSITEEALKLLAKDPRYMQRKATVLYNKDWHKGVVGIVASRLIDSYYRPTIVLTESNGFATGSARSVAGFDLYSAISECSDLLESFGGHMYAAGLTLKIENLKVFRERFEAIVEENIRPDQLIPQVEIDAEIQLSEITHKFFRILKQFEPFGPGNMNPVFFTENVSDDGDGRVVGMNKDHLKLNLIHETAPFIHFPAIAFGMGHLYEKISRGYGFDIAYTITENEFMGKTNLQLNIKDIKLD